MTNVDEAILTQQRIASRELGTIARERERKLLSSNELVVRLTRIRAALDEVPAAWSADTERQVDELHRLALALEQLQVEAQVEGYGGIQFVQALDAIEWNWERSIEKVARAWDGAQQLVGALRDPRFVGIAEVDTQLARFAAISVRVEAELAPKLAAMRAAPMIAAVSEAIDALNREIDYDDEEAMRARRAELRGALAALPAEVAEERERAADAFARSDKDRVLQDELGRLETAIVPYIEAVERALASGSAPRAIEHAPRLLAALPQLASYATHERARRLEARGRAALDRIAPELGAATHEAVLAADHVPQFSLAVTSTRVEAVLRRLNEVFANYRATYLDTSARFDAQDIAVDRLLELVDSASRELVRFARRAGELATELAEIDPAQPAIAATHAAVPVLIARVQTWKARLASYAELATELAETQRYFERAAEAEQTFENWPEILAWLATAEQHVGRAAGVIPDEQERLLGWRTKIGELRATTIANLTSACVVEVARNMKFNATDEAERYVQLLRDAVPDSPDLARLAASIAGSANAREQTILEIERYGAMLRRCAEDTARSARSAYDSWVGEREPVHVLAQSIVRDPDKFRGKFVAGRCSHLGLSLADEPWPLEGEIYQVDYDPAVRDELRAAMDKLDGLYQAHAERVIAEAGLENVPSTTQHYPRDAHYHAEIVGLAQYTPTIEVRDATGLLLGTIAGAPYPVPRVVIRALATTYFVVTPGEAPNLDALQLED